MNFRSTAGLAAFLWLSSLAAGQQTQVLLRARELAKTGRLADAEQVLTAAIQAGGDTAELHGELGNLLCQSGRFSDAIPELGRAVQLDADSPEYNMKLAGALMGDRRYPVALEFLQAVKSRFESLPEYQYNIGMSYFGMHDYPKATGAFRRALDLAPNMDLAHFFLGNISVIGGDLQRGVEEYRQALKLNPKNASYCFALGKVLGRMAPQFEPEAVRWLRKALELTPDHAPSEYELGRICERAGDLACARPLLEHLVSRYPDLLAAHYALARIYTKLGMPDAAARETAQVRRLSASAPGKSVLHEIEAPSGDLPVPTIGSDPGPAGPRH
jgi:tetratricopeptide (TPR) repeat protein